MLVLALNCGSSSLKFALYGTGRDGARPGAGALERRASGEVDRIHDTPLLRATIEGPDLGRLPETTTPLDESGHEAAAQAVLAWLAGAQLVPLAGPDVIGHRVVHGGPRFREPAVIDADVLQAIEAAGELAVLHNAPALAVIRATMARAQEATRHVACFDTAFHRSMPPRAARYAIPGDLAERHGLWRYGFHGLAHAAMVEGAGQALGRDARDLRLVTLQLGAGCSAAAVDGGRSIDTSMGLTPLEGLMMATRSGDVDPALPGILARAEGVPLEDAEAWLNQRSGLLGVSGRSADIRDLLRAEGDGDEQAALAIEMFCYRVRKQAGAYLAALEGADAIVFGGGIGEHQPEIRRRICEPLAALGVTLDAEANRLRPAGEPWRVDASDSRIAVVVAPVDEQHIVAREALAAVGAG